MKYNVGDAVGDFIIREECGRKNNQNIRIADQKIQSTNTTRKKLFILEQKESRVICDSAMEFGRRYGVNGRSVGNLVRGKTKSAGGWTLYKLISLPLAEPIETIIEKESVTTNLLTTM